MRLIKTQTNCLLLRREALFNAGLFDESLLRHQDVQLLARFTYNYKLMCQDEFLNNLDQDDNINRAKPEKVMAINLFIFDKKLQGKDFTYSEEEYRGLELAIDKKLNPSKYTTEQEQKAIEEISGSISTLLANNSGLSIEEIISQIKKKL